MSNFTKQLTGQVSFSGLLGQYRWYSGTFKEASIGVIRAVSRAINNYLTKNPQII